MREHSALVAGCAMVIALSRTPIDADATAGPATHNPLELWSSIRMAIAFQLSITLIAVVRAR